MPTSIMSALRGHTLASGAATPSRGRTTLPKYPVREAVAIYSFTPVGRPWYPLDQLKMVSESLRGRLRDSIKRGKTSFYSSFATELLRKWSYIPPRQIILQNNPQQQDPWTTWIEYLTYACSIHQEHAHRIMQ